MTSSSQYVIQSIRHGVGMKTISFMGQKGGGGKTTLTCHCAVEAEREGAKVGVVDTDPQGSCSGWGMTRQLDTPIIAKATAQELHDVIKAGRHDGIAYLMFDSAPHAAPSATRVAAASDLIVIPVRPNAFDLAAIPATMEIIKASGKPAVFVLSACPTRSNDSTEAADVLSKYGLPVSPVHIHERRAYARAVISGRSVAEFEPSGKAAQEIAALWQWLKEQL